MEMASVTAINYVLGSFSLSNKVCHYYHYLKTDNAVYQGWLPLVCPIRQICSL